jgi:hypothetical protein
VILSNISPLGRPSPLFVVPRLVSKPSHNLTDGIFASSHVFPLVLILASQNMVLQHDVGLLVVQIFNKPSESRPSDPTQALTVTTQLVMVSKYRKEPTEP